MNKIFPGKTLRPISYPYSRKCSGKKSEKSLGRFSRKIGNGPTDYPTTIPSLTSTEVENCNVDPVHLLNVSTFWTFWPDELPWTSLIVELIELDIMNFLGLPCLLSCLVLLLLLTLLELLDWVGITNDLLGFLNFIDF